jgi:hypothetical protein
MGRHVCSALRSGHVASVMLLGIAAVAGAMSAHDGGAVVNGPPPPTYFYTLPPCRVVDTRWPDGPLGGPALAPASTRSFAVTSTPCGIPVTATSVSVNVTAVLPAAVGNLTVYPGNEDAPTASTLNFRPGVTRANNAVVALAVDTTGTIKVKNSSAGPVHFVLDVNGYFE